MSNKFLVFLLTFLLNANKLKEMQREAIHSFALMTVLKTAKMTVTRTSTIVLVIPLASTIVM